MKTQVRAFLESVQEMLPWIEDAEVVTFESPTKVEEKGVLTVPRERIRETLEFLRDHEAAQFESVVEILGVDWPQRPKRFDVIYELLSFRMNTRMTVKVQAAEAETVCPPIGIFAKARFVA